MATTINPHRHGSWGNLTLSPSSAGTIYTIGAGGTGGSGTYYTSGTNGSNWTTSATPYVTVGASSNSALKVSGDADIQGNLKVNGVDISHTLAKIQDRLAILVPNPALLDKYEALRQAYDYYKTLEALCVDETGPGEKK